MIFDQYKRVHLFFSEMEGSKALHTPCMVLCKALGV